MASVNASREKLAQQVNDAIADAKLLAINDDGQICAWFGGYSFNVYDAARDWQEVDHFTSGDLASGRGGDDQRRDMAAAHMKGRGYDPIR